MIVYYFGEEWFWHHGDEKLIGVDHLKNLKILIKKDNITRMVNLRDLKKSL